MPTPRPPEQSPRERMRDAVQQIVKNVADDKALSRANVKKAKARIAARRRRQVWQLLGVAAVLAASIVWAMPRWQRPFDPPTGAVAERDARRAIVFAARLVVEYEGANGAPPATLADLGVALPGIEYRRFDAAWTLTVRVDGRAITFQDGDDPGTFLNAQ